MRVPLRRLGLVGVSLALAGCPDDHGPIVIATSPEDQATGVERDAIVEATFLGDIAPSTLDQTTFVMTRDGTRVAGTVSYDQATRVATFDPQGELDLLGEYTATLTTGVTDWDSPLAAAVSWSFTVRDKSWDQAQRLHDHGGSGDAYDSQLAVDGSGNAFAVWTHVSNTPEVWASRFVPGSGWGGAVLLGAGTGVESSPGLAVDPSGNATVLWLQWDGAGNDLQSIRFEPGSGWGIPALLESDSDGVWSPHVAVDAAGNAIATWAQGPGVWARRFVPGAGWGVATQIDTGLGGGGWDPRVAIDASGVATAVWQQSGIRTSIASNRFAPRSGWGTAILIETDDDTHAQYPDIAVAPSGEAIAIWEHNDHARNNVWANRYVPGVGWGTPALIETENAGDAYRPAVAIDPSGTATAVWVQDDGDHFNVWSNRYVPGLGWESATLLELDDTGNAESPHVAVDASGTATAVWSQYDGTPTLNLWASRRIPGAGWGPPVLIESDDAGFATMPRVAVDPSSDTVIAVWSQTREGAFYAEIWASSFR